MKKVAELNDKLRKNLFNGKIEVVLSDMVKISKERAQIIKAVREFRVFDNEIDFNQDHSIGIVIVDTNAYVFRFFYLDDRYHYDEEIGRRSLEICHVSEFKSVKLKSKINDRFPQLNTP